MPEATSRKTHDAAYAGTIEFLMMIVVLSVISIPVFTAYLTQTHFDAGGSTLAYEQVTQQIRDLIRQGDRLCCPSDPSAPSYLQDVAMAEWAGDEGAMRRNFSKWFPTPDATVFTTQIGYVPSHGLNIEYVDLYKPREPTGMVAGAMVQAQPPERGPAYLIPRLDKVAGAASIDFQYVPLVTEWPYRTGAVGQHNTWIKTRVEYLRTALSESFDLNLERDVFTEVSGTWVPGMDMHFEEPDWLAAPHDPETTFFTLVLTKDALAAERALFPDPNPALYPQHGFLLDLTLQGPGRLSYAPPDTGEQNDDPAIVEDAYTLEVRVPRGWTAVEFIDDDDFENDFWGWRTSTITELPGGDWLITATLDAAATFRAHLNPPHPIYGPIPTYIVEPGASVPAPFRFHARPPTLDAANDVGFHTLRATLTHLNVNVRQEALLVVELATNPGRVHRTIAAYTPNVVPPTPAPTGTPNGILLPIGAVLLNGGEETRIKKITWEAPTDTFWSGTGSPEKLFDFSDDGVKEGVFTISDDGRQVIWTAPLNVQGEPLEGICAPLAACSVAAMVRMDGANLQASGLWPQGETDALYRLRDVDPYVKWFVRKDWAYHGVPESIATGAPGFALAMARANAGPGDVKGGYTWTLPPSTDPVCNEDDIDERDRATRTTSDGRIHYDFGPHDDGLPYVGSLAQCPSIPDGLALDFALISRSGSTAGGINDLASIGKAKYSSPTGMSTESYTAWQNGVAESYATGPLRVKPGTTGTFHLVLDSLSDTLVNGGVGTASLTIRIVDPYNAWEDRAWLEEVLVQNEPLQFGPDPGPQHCQIVPGEPPCGGPLHMRYDIDVAFPDRLPLGTHLFIAEISWSFASEAVTAADIEQTANVIRPFDVVTGADQRARAAILGGTAWMQDWG